MTKINPEKFVAICNKLGLQVERQPSQYKVTGSDGKRFYIPGTKTVHKVELSGWSHPLAVTWETLFPGKKSPSPKITHVVNFAQEEKLVLRDFFKMAKSIASSKPAEEPASPPAEAPASAPVPEAASA